MIRKIRAFLYFLGLFLPVVLQAAAWLQPKGEGLAIGNVQQYTSCKYWDKQGRLHQGPCFRQFALTPYFEYGAFSNLTLVGSPNFNEFSQSGQKVSFGFENLFIGGRYGLFQQDWNTLSVQLSYNQPIRTGFFGNPLTPTSTYALINRQRYLDARILYGTGGYADKNKINTWYADFETSYQPNFNGAATEFHFNLMLGLKTAGGRLIFELQELNSVTANNPRNITFPNYNLCTLIPNVIYWYKLNKAAIQLGVQQDFYGTNIGKGTAPFVALWWKF